VSDNHLLGVKMAMSNASVNLPIVENAIGIGLRSPHYHRVLDEQPKVGWLEVHSENFFNANSTQCQMLDQLADIYPLSFHGVGLSLGSVDPVNLKHLAKMKALIDAYKPALISEHLSWSSFGDRYFNDLLPMPLTLESLDVFCDKLNLVQDHLGRALAIENPTVYLAFKHSTINEWDFLNEITRRCQSTLLLDLNNIYVNSVNLDNINIDAITEIHLAGFTRKQLENGEILIDTHGSEVSEPVWELFRYLREQCDAPALIEWDTDIPELEVLLAQAHRAEREQQRLDRQQRVNA